MKMKVIPFAILCLAVTAVWAQPDCPGTSTEICWDDPLGVGPQICFTTPDILEFCPGNEGCCQDVYSTGIPANWTVVGFITSTYEFTSAKDSNGDPIPPQVIPGASVEYTPLTPNLGNVSERLCFPEASDWASFETHTDISLQVFDEFGNQVTYVGADPIFAPGVIGPGQDWDNFCTDVGCTPGFWKNHYDREPPDPKDGGDQDVPWPGGLEIDDNFNDVFGTVNPDSDVTLLAALSARGNNKFQALLRGCTAALLNSYMAGMVQAIGGNCIAFDFCPDPLTNIGLGPGDVIAVCAEAVDNGTRAERNALYEALDYCNNASMCAPDSDNVWMNNAGGVFCDGTDPCNPWWDAP